LGGDPSAVSLSIFGDATVSIVRAHEVQHPRLDARRASPWVSPCHESGPGVINTATNDRFTHGLSWAELSC
jgi:hypothetical protein